MTDSNNYYHGFMSVLQSKTPHKATLVNAIADLLDIDKDAVYRRLRGEVNFSFSEIAVIAKNQGISLDKIVGTDIIQSRPAQMTIARLVNPSDSDYELFNNYIFFFKIIKDEPNTILMEAANILPHTLYHDYEYLTRYYIFRWNHGSNYFNVLPYHEISIPERLRVLQKENCSYARHIKSTVYVLDFHIFQRLVTDIKYFAKVRLINENDVSLIKNDLVKFLDSIEYMAINGKHEETGNEINLFISDITCDMNYCCVKSKNIYFTFFRTFILNATVTFDIEVFNAASSWILSQQNLSTLISVSGDKFRALYFDSQRKIIDTL